MQLRKCFGNKQGYPAFKLVRMLPRDYTKFSGTLAATRISQHTASHPILRIPRRVLNIIKHCLFKELQTLYNFVLRNGYTIREK